MKNDKQVNILILDDNPRMRETLRDILSEEGYRVTTASNLTEARKNISQRFYHLALADLRLNEGSGLDLLREIKDVSRDTMVIIFTAYGSLDTALSAIGDGAFGYLQKPLNMDEAKIMIKKALGVQRISLENKSLISKLKKLSLKDSQTGLYNYRYLMERLSSEFKRAKRYVLPLSVIMLDIDYFKSINEVYGHHYGDSILKEFAGYLKNCSRSNDILVRYGGEEFVILMPDTYKEGALTFGERLLNMLRERVLDRAGKRIRLKISMGLSSFPEDDIGSSSELLDAADKTLNEAKEQGGNRLLAFKNVSGREIKDIIKDGGKENVEKLKRKLSKMKGRANQMLLESIFAFAKAVEAKDYSTSKHSENMVSIATALGKKLNLSSDGIEYLQYAAMLHDLGKIGIPDKILHKRGKLTSKEYEKIKNHPLIGAEIVRDIHFLKEVVPMILYHHERFDGFGYSAGIRGKEIPLGARIIAIADVYQALISDRPYRKAYGRNEAIKIIREGSGTQFDPEIVKAFLEVLNDLSFKNGKVCPSGH